MVCTGLNNVSCFVKVRKNEKDNERTLKEGKISFHLIGFSIDPNHTFIDTWLLVVTVYASTNEWTKVFHGAPKD